MIKTHLIEDKSVKINWCVGDVVDTHDHEIHYSATGVDDNGVEYQATAVSCLDEIDFIDIEIIMKKIDWKEINQQVSGWMLNYATINGIKSLIIGVSGGVDSAVVSYLSALTGLKVYVVSMPIRQPIESLGRATRHIEWLKEKFPNVESIFFDLTEHFEMMDNSLREQLGIDNELCSANLRARLRANTLYHIAGNTSGIVVGTGNKVEDFGVGFYTKYGDGAVDISPIADFLKSEVYAMGRQAGINTEILVAKPTDDLRANGATDEQQIGASYNELEWAMSMSGVYKPEGGREKDVMKIFEERRSKNLHKMIPIPVFDAEDAIVRQIGYRPSRASLNMPMPEL